MSETKPETLTELQTRYQQLAMQKGDLTYRIECITEDAAKITEEMKKVNQAAAKLQKEEADKVKPNIEVIQGGADTTATTETSA